MLKGRIVHVFIVGMLFCFFALTVSAQEGIADEEKYDFLIDQALDQVEEGLDIKGDEASLIEEIQAEVGPGNVALPSAPEAVVSQDVMILDEVKINEGVMAGKKLDTKIIPLLHAEAASIIETLEQMKSPEGIVSYNGEDRTLMIKEESKLLEAMSAYVKRVDILLETVTFELVYIEAKECIEAIEKILTKNVGQVQLGEQANTIVATDTPLKIGEITELVEKLDYLDKGIQIETKILQIVLNDEHVDGVDWEAIVSDYQRVLFKGFTFEKGTEDKEKLDLGAVSEEDYIILLEALDTVGIVNEISDEMINTESDITHTISVSLSGSVNGGDRSEPETRQEQVHFFLTPMINRSGLLTVSITPKFTGGQVNRLEQVSDEKIEIQIENGATIIIGSLFNEVMVESSWKIPLLGDLPLLGFVFRNQGEVPRKAEIITFITVRIVEKER